MKICSLGSYAPQRLLTNDDLSQMVETNDQWIRERTGIHRRHIVAQGENVVDMALEAAQRALAGDGVQKDTIGLVLVATFTAHQKTPSVASQLQSALGLPEDVLAFDINGACSGFLFALATAEGLLQAMPGKRALVVGADANSQVMDYTDRGSCILFGDGAGVAVVELDGRATYSDFGTRSNNEVLYTDEKNLLHMAGREVYQFAVRTVPQTLRKVLEKANMTLDQVDHIICHQANARIVEAVAKHMKQPIEKYYMNINEYGNTSAASIPLVLDEMNRKGLFAPGQNLLLTGFGSGLSWGSYLLAW